MLPDNRFFTIDFFYGLISQSCHGLGRVRRAVDKDKEDGVAAGARTRFASSSKPIRP